MNTKQRRTLARLFEQPVRSDVRWSELESLMRALGADQVESSGSRVRFVFADGFIISAHRPHPKPELKKYAVEQIRERLIMRGIAPEER